MRTPARLAVLLLTATAFHVRAAEPGDQGNRPPEMDRLLEKTRRDLWAGCDLPFPVALEGGGPTLIVYSTRTARGATTALYGIDGFPTTLLIDRDGTLVGEMDVDGEKGRAEILRCQRAANAPTK